MLVLRVFFLTCLNAPVYDLFSEAANEQIKSPPPPTLSKIY